MTSLRALDGVRIEAGEEFSFNDTVGTWSTDAGYRKAPVSYNGQLVWAVGGGVCQTSTTLYNAALLSGLDVTERHRHHFAPGYVPPGRDAAVAYNTIDLRLRNPHPWPVTLRTSQKGQQVVIEIYGAAALETTYRIDADIAEVRPADTLRGGRATAQARLIHPGSPAYASPPGGSLPMLKAPIANSSAKTTTPQCPGLSCTSGESSTSASRASSQASKSGMDCAA